jgi:hypothetical protein
MKTPAWKPKRLLLAFLLLAAAIFAIYASNRKPGGWWKGGSFSLALIEHGGFTPKTQGVFISNTPGATNQSFPLGIDYVVSGNAADEIILILNRYNVWQWSDERKMPKQDAVACTAILGYRGKTNQWTWYPSSSQTRPDETPFTKTLRNLGKYGTPNTPDMQQQFSEIQRIIQTHTNDVTRAR